MVATGQVTFDNVGNPDGFVCGNLCRRITLRERDGATTTYNVRVPLATSPPYRKLPGEETVIEAPDGEWLHEGDTVGFFETLDVASAVFALVYEL